MRTRSVYILILFIIQPLFVFCGQSKIDSLLFLLNQKPGIVKQVEYLYALGNEYRKSDLSKAMRIADRLFISSKETKYELAKAKAYHLKGNIYYQLGLNDSSLYCFKTAQMIYNNYHLKNEYFIMVNNIAGIYGESGKVDSSQLLYFQALSYFESVDDKRMVGQILGNIGSNFYITGLGDKAIDYNQRALKVQREIFDTSGMIISLVNLMCCATSYRDFKGGEVYGEEAAGLAKGYDIFQYANVLTDLCVCYLELGKVDLALESLKETIIVFKKNNCNTKLGDAYGVMAECYVKKKQYPTAKKYALKALSLADTAFYQKMRIIYRTLELVSVYLNEPENAMYYSGLKTEQHNKDREHKFAEKLADAEKKYETVKKEKKIVQLQTQKRMQSLLILSISIFLLLILATSYFIVKNFRNKKILSDQKIKQLEQEHQLAAAHALIQGENQERSRISKDLHDGLGGLLSGIKLKLNHMKGDVIIPEESAQEFDHALDLLDKSIVHLREVAHNMMPETLIKLGLKDALHDVCQTLNESQSIKIVFQHFGDTRRMEQTIEISAYRIVQELVHNAIKHSKAQLITVQLLQEPERLGIIVQDDGKGFDTKIANEGKGMGLKNIKSRVESLKGRMDIHSEPGKGTEMHIDFFI